jgi:hypothetical protein
MAKVTIYRFRLYDIATDEYVPSRRWATMEAIRRIGGEAFDDTATEIDDSLLSHDLPGMTDRDFKPRKPGGSRLTATKRR